jgi:tetratricopeptide (TPR) repeat protein
MEIHMLAPLCFVLMPFGKKQNATGGIIDFDAVYAKLIAPAIQSAGMEPLRADEEVAGGVIHKPMFERLILCDFAIADLTTANANVFYELGLRHAVRPASTILIFARNAGQLPFDVAPLRAIPYTLDRDGTPGDAAAESDAIARRLKENLKGGAIDSPVFQLVEGCCQIQHLKTDVFRDRVEYSMQVKSKLAAARRTGIEAVRAVEKDIEPIASAEAGVVLDLFLSYRAVKAWEDMIALTRKMSPALANTVLVQEQLGLALNRGGRDDEAEKTLLDLVSQRGPSSETYGLLGRVYKDRWEKAEKEANGPLAAGMLKKAIDAYRKGFEADWRDAYPGVNAVTLMELKDPPDPERLNLLPVVRYAVERKIAAGRPDYWDHATRLELAVLAKQESEANEALAEALASVREAWEPETTQRNLRLIREARQRRGEKVVWAHSIEDALERQIKDLGADLGS